MLDVSGFDGNAAESAACAEESRDPALADAESAERGDAAQSISGITSAGTMRFISRRLPGHRRTILE
jgi:hypothetical protein